MGWAVRIIKGREPVKKINFRKWFLYFVLFISLNAIVFYISTLATEQARSDFKLVYIPFSFLSLVFFILIFILRVYVFGIMLTNQEAYAKESERLKKKWLLWGDEKVFVLGYNCFTPHGMNSELFVKEDLPNIYTGQILKFENFLTEEITEEYVYLELLSSVREKIKKISLTHQFRVVFISPEDSTVFRIFKNCWEEMGFPLSGLVSPLFISDNYVNYISGFLDETPEEDVVRIIIANFSCEGKESSEFASILLLSHYENNALGVIRRPLFTTKNELSVDLEKIQTYQSSFNSVQGLRFSGMAVKEQTMLCDALQNVSLQHGKENMYTIQDLNMFFGEQGVNHSWLSLTYALTAAKMTCATQLMVAKENGMFFFNVIEPYVRDDEREKTYE